MQSPRSIEPADTRRDTRRIYETTSQDWFVVTTKAKAPDPYPDASGGGVVLPCVYSLTTKYAFADSSLTQRDSTRYDLIYVPEWVPEGTTIRAVRVNNQLFGVQPDQPYTVRRYDSSGNTLWVQDYFRGAVSGEWVTTINLSVATIGSRVFVAGPRVAHVEPDTSVTYWNLCVYELATGQLIDRFDLWDSTYARPLYGTGDISDICAGADGNLGVVFWQHQFVGVAYNQLVASFNPLTLSMVWSDLGGIGQPSDPIWNKIEMDASGVAHMGATGEKARKAIKLDGTTEYQVGSQIDSTLSTWWANTAFVAKSPGATPSPSNISLGNIYIAVSGAWPTHLIEENGPIPPTARTHVWWTLTTRGIYTGTDSASDVKDVAIVKSGGSVTRVIAVGAGFVRGASQAALPFYGTPLDPSNYGIQATNGTLQDQGCVSIFDDSGNFVKAYSPVGITSIGRIDTVPGAGYYLGTSPLPGLPTLMARDAADAHVWAHHHQSPTDLVVDSAGGVITVGLSSKRSSETSFLPA